MHHLSSDLIAISTTFDSTFQTSGVTLKTDQGLKTDMNMSSQIKVLRALI